MTMEDIPPPHKTSSHSPDANASGRKRSGSGASILSKFPFLRTSESKSSLHESRFQHPSSTSGDPVNSENASDRPPRALAAAMSQQKTRRRRGSLRKVALLGRGAAREKRELKSQPEQQQLPQTLALDTAQILLQQTLVPPPIQQQSTRSDTMAGGTIIGLGLSDATPHPSTDGFASRAVAAVPAKPFPVLNYDTQMTSPTISYTSTTDEDDGLSTSLPVPLLSQPDREGFSSGSESYFRSSSQRAQSPAHSIQRRRSTSKQQYAKSPLSLQGLATGSPALGNIDSGHHDYSETEWWGWVVLVVTWFVFIVGMGSCLNIWSWAWDVGSTPYAPPELEDDPTLPIVGYYPALIILTSIMAWVWVIVAWVGMKYFRHAKISGD
ncbi:hypothetical protein E0Z10_g2598 [Xylaria hypoxylon]|uniref:Uncharacterized protein n=1 Tax=Xylaria hypoxylon TaxID=37992 RepID=A0A4Z0YQC9_9PEZI|nr:hypothetical protein E0Z10_g2598 [Xylaria hypoxylon]